MNYEEAINAEIKKRKANQIQKQVEEMTDEELALLQMINLYKQLEKRLDMCIDDVRKLKYK